MPATVIKEVNDEVRRFHNAKNASDTQSRPHSEGSNKKHDKLEEPLHVAKDELRQPHELDRISSVELRQTSLNKQGNPADADGR